MTEYSNVPQVNALYQESQVVANAIRLIDQGGTLASFTISPPPNNMGVPPTGGMMMAVSISTTSPSSPALMSEIRKSLVDREGEIAKQLEDLGVTAQPPLVT
jgi:hypothetical protein